MCFPSQEDTASAVIKTPALLNHGNNKPSRTLPNLYVNHCYRIGPKFRPVPAAFPQPRWGGTEWTTSKGSKSFKEGVQRNWV